MVIDGHFVTLTDDRSSIFRLPFKSKLSLAKPVTRDEKQITTIQHASSSAGHSRHEDYATHLKNQILIRKIHETLHSRNSASLPNLSNGVSPAVYRERSVDGTPRAKSESPTSVIEEEPETLVVPVSVDKVEEKREETVAKRVQFEEINEIVDEEMFAVQRTNSFVIESTQTLESFSPNSLDSLPSPSGVLPPTPMKRKSRENSFEGSATSLVASDQHDGPPLIKPRTKRLLHRTSDVSVYVEEVASPVIENVTVENTMNDVQVEPKIESVRARPMNGCNETSDNEKTQTSRQKLGPALSIEICSPFEIPPSQPIEVQVVPKSILKTSEASSTQKSISFQPLTQSISYQKELSSSSESDSDEDVWSRVDQHRSILNRHQDDGPPPLPKTPPPPLDNEEEKYFSFA